MTEDNDEDFIQKNQNSNRGSSTKKIPNIDQNEVIDEEDEDKFGLDFLQAYQSSMRSKRKSTVKTKDRTESEFISSPVSRPSLKKRISVKKVVRRESMSGTSNVKKRKFSTIDERS